MPAGTCSLVFTKPGLSTFLFRSVAHPQVGVITRLPEIYSLVQEPTIRATGLQATSIMATTGGGETVPAINFRTTLTTLLPDTNHDYVLYFGTTPDVSYLTATSSLLTPSPVVSFTMP